MAQTRGTGALIGDRMSKPGYRQAWAASKVFCARLISESSPIPGVLLTDEDLLCKVSAFAEQGTPSPASPLIVADISMT